MNASLKSWMENKKGDISQVVTDIRGFVTKQRHDVGKAFTEMSGPYSLKDEYKDAKMSPDFWALEPSKRKLLLDKVSAVPMIVVGDIAEEPLKKELQKLNAKFLDDQVTALKFKVERILNGNLCDGFHGPKSQIVPSESGNQLHVIKYTSEHNYVCCTRCLQFQMHSICSYSLAASADNNDLHCYVDLYLQKNQRGLLES